jgi:hypothetical protein
MGEDQSVQARPQRERPVHRRTRQTNSFLEAINGLFQAAKRKARGYGRFQTMRVVIFLVAGNLRFSAINPHAV